MLIVVKELSVLPRLPRRENFAPHFPIQIASAADAVALLSGQSSTGVGFIPHAANPAMPLPEMPCENFLAPWLPETDFPPETAVETCPVALAWLASTCLAQAALPKLGDPENWSLLAMAESLEAAGIPFRWGTAGKFSSRQNDRRCTVLALVPHYHCEVWLQRCLRSLINQTHSPDGIVVIDDGSGCPPIDIVQQFPTVTLLASPVRVGPYRLIQQVIEATHYWGYLFQDADDWSSCDRLEQLLKAAETTGADLIGTQEIRVHEEDSHVSLVSYPLDVNAALAEKPGHPLLHPSSLVTRDLVCRIGGFATGLRFGGDTEFLLRAALVGRVVNIPDYSYFRRKRSHSLTTDPHTGLESPARQELLKRLKQRAIANRAAIRAGQSADLTPLATAEPIPLSFVMGSPLNWI